MSAAPSEAAPASGGPRIGVVGGTFDPPHIAHLAIGAAAKQALALDRVLFVPAGDPWRKAGRDVTPAPLRLRMLRAALEPLPWAEISTVELDRPGPSYITVTMPLLAAQAPDHAQWWFVLGDDALEDFPYWHEPDRLLTLARLALVWRPPGPTAIPDAVHERFPGVGALIDYVPMPPLDVSSTELRQLVRDGRATDLLLPEAVRTVVDEAGLYR